MKVLIVGGGGREHALAWRFAQSPSVSGVLASPGNPGMAELATCLPWPDTVAGYADLAAAHNADLTVVGPEAPLVAGIVDQFQLRRLPIIGPTQAAARLEGSKIFAKQLLQQAGIPTARSVAASSYEQAVAALSQFALPVVIKADGLAAGKGVVIAQTRPEALAALQSLGPQLLLEEFLIGEEISFMGLSNGVALLPFAPTQDHKRLLDGDRGPNTGGMGAYRDPGLLTSAQHGDIMDRIMLPALAEMQKQGAPFTGFLYAGLMMTADGPKVLEFNARLGDPETQCLLYSYPGDFAAQLQGFMQTGDTTPSDTGAAQQANPAVCVVIASAGYPEKPEVERPIRGIAAAQATGATVFHAGTRLTSDGLVSTGGRVLGVTAGGGTLPEAIAAAYAAVQKIEMPGMQYRSDIGQKGLRRW